MKKIIVLGSTGSIGRQTLDIVRNGQYHVTAIAAYSNTELLKEQINEFHPEIAVCVNDKCAFELKHEMNGSKTEILCGTSGLSDCIFKCDYDSAVNGIAGMAGTIPAINILKSGHDLISANKEAIVTCGELINKTAKENNAKIIPADSEHSAIFQCLNTKNPNSQIKRILLTASGGPFFGMSKNELKNVTKQQALKHPNWTMGKKITIDCATMMNKGLELIEAVNLFDVRQDQIDIIVHRESIIHSMVEFYDNAVIAQLGSPDMRLPLQYALTYPDRFPSQASQLDLCKIGSLTFRQPDTEVFTALNLARNVLKAGGTAPVIMCVANEIAVDKFMNDEIGFTDIVPFTENILNSCEIITNPCIEDILQTAQKVRSQYSNHNV